MAISLIKEFKQKQKISLTPLLKKSIDLLQLSRYELIQKIDREIEINPFVEKEISEDFDINENYNDSSFDFNVAAVENLRDTLINQINDLRLDINDKEIALTIIDCIDESGQLIDDIDEININKTINVDVPIIGDVKQVVDRMISVWREKNYKIDTESLKSWWDKINKWKEIDCLSYNNESKQIKPNMQYKDFMN